MAQSFVIPTYFTAIDRFSGPVQQMAMKMEKFGSVAETGVARSERAFRKMTPTISHAGKELLAFAETAAIAAASVELIHFSFDAAERYEMAIVGLQAASNATGAQMEKYEEQIKSVATATRRGASETAEAFKVVGSLNPELYKNAEALGAVAQASIILSQAQNTELATSATDLTKIMRAFKMPAEDANRIINVMQATVSKGGIAYSELASSMESVAIVSKTANLTFEQTAAAIAVINKANNSGEASGGVLQRIIVKLQTAHVGYKNGMFDMGEAIDTVNKKLSLLSPAMQQQYLKQIAGRATMIPMLQALLQNKDGYDDLTKSITGTNAAQEASEKRMDTLKGFVTRLGGAWDRWINTTSTAGGALTFMKNAIGFITDHLSGLLTIAGSVLVFFGAWWAAMKVVNFWIWTTKISLDAMSLVSMTRYIASTRGVTVATAAWGIAQESLNGILFANPIGAVIVGVAALSAGIYLLTRYINSETAAEKINSDVRERALHNTVEQRTQAMLLFESLRRTTIGTDAYTDILKKIDAIQPGIIDKYNLQAGAIDNIRMAEEELMKTIVERAKVEARVELFKEKTKALIEAQDDKSTTWMDKLRGFGTPGGADYSRAQRLRGMENEMTELGNQVTKDVMDQQNESDKTELLSPHDALIESQRRLASAFESWNEKNINININSKGAVSGGGSGLGVIPNVGSTHSAYANE